MTVLRSIDLRADLKAPDRAAHWRPTGKVLPVVAAVIGTEGSAVTAVAGSYGAGKSLAALVGGLGVVDRIAGALLGRLKTAAPELAAFAGREGRGRVVALSGHIANLSDALASGFCIKPGPLDDVLARAARLKADRLAIVWDEFGRHLETLVALGRADQLAEVQQLAEWAVRRKRPVVTFTVLMHREMHHYAGRLGQAAQADWRKIEGRFASLRVIEDSDEIYEVIADAAAELMPGVSPEEATDEARAAHAAGLFPARDVATLAPLLGRAWGLQPTALWLLPRVAARIAQAERTIFGILSQEVGPEPVDLETLWRAFGSAMRSDTGPGGSAKAWVETEAARARAETALERAVLAGTTLLHLGQVGRIGLDRLVALLVLGLETPRGQIASAVEALLARKLLLHRRLTDVVSVWEGSDIDLRAQVSSTAEGLRNGDPLERLGRLVEAPSFLADRYNHARGMTRFARGTFVTSAALRDPETRTALEVRADAEDALIAFVIDGTAEDGAALEWPGLVDRPHLILAWAERNPDLAEASLEVAALTALETDEALLEIDPRLRREVQEMRADALDFLLARARLLTDPAASASTWFVGGQPLERPDPGPLLSDIMDRRFHETPRIVNEQVVRRRVTPQTKSARKRLLLAILERSTSPELGYENQTTADASLYRTVLRQTGLHGPTGWAEASAIKDESLARTWGLVEAFYQNSSSEPKSFSLLVEKLLAPPYGIRQGLIPILIGGGLRAFGKSLALREEIEGQWRFVEDVTPSLVEKIGDDPSRFSLTVLPFGPPELDAVRRMTASLTDQTDPVEGDVVRAFHDALVAWRQRLPTHVMTTTSLPPEGVALRLALRKTRNDAATFLTMGLSDAANAPLGPEAVAFFSKAKRQIEDAARMRERSALSTLINVFGNDDGERLTASMGRWVEMVPDDKLTNDRLDRRARALIRIGRQAGARSDKAIMLTISKLLVGQDPVDWDDATARRFDRGVRELVRDIEDAILSAETIGSAAVHLLERRISSDLERLERALGPSAARTTARRLLGDGT